MKRYNFSVKERIKSKKDFEKIYSSGKVIISSDKRIKATYLIEKNSARPGIKIAAAVSRKAGIAVWRNRVKRLIRESYRYNKHALTEISSKNKVLLKVVFSPYFLNERKNKKVKITDVEPGILEIMIKIKSSI